MHINRRGCRIGAGTVLLASAAMVSAQSVVGAWTLISTGPPPPRGEYSLQEHSSFCLHRDGTYDSAVWFGYGRWTQKGSQILLLPVHRVAYAYDPQYGSQQSVSGPVRSIHLEVKKGELMFPTHWRSNGLWFGRAGTLSYEKYARAMRDWMEKTPHSVSLSRPGKPDHELYLSAYYGESENVRRYLAEGANANSSEDPLFLAVFETRLDIVRLLLDAGANANGPKGEDRTPLMCCARGNNPTCVPLLLSRGADPFRKDKTGNSAIDYARKYGPKTLLLLLRASRTKRR